MSQINTLKASLTAEEAKFRSACQHVQLVAAKCHSARQRVAESTASLWSEVVKRKVTDGGNATVCLLRERVTGGAEEALSRLGKDVHHTKQVTEELAQQSAVVASLSDGLAVRGAMVERLERRAAARRENQNEEEIAELASLASVGQGVEVFLCAPSAPVQPVAVSQQPLMGDVVPGACVTTANTFTPAETPRYVPTVESAAPVTSGPAEKGAVPTTVSLTLTDPIQKVATARVQVTTEKSGALVAEVTVASTPLCERVVDHTSQIHRKLAELDLPLASLTVLHGDPTADGRRNGRQIKVKRKQEEGDDEVHIA